jgi:hypothetical protein
MTRETGRWRWSDVYPNTHVVTLVLPHDDARALLDQARAEGRMIARDTVLGMPSMAAGSGPQNHTPIQGSNSFFSVVRVLDTEQERPVPPVAETTEEHGEQTAGEQADERAPQQAEGNSNVVILPCVRRERLDDDKPAKPDPRPRPLPARAKRIVVPSSETALTVRPRRSVLDERPPVPPAPEPQPRTKFNPATGKVMRAGEVTAAERQMVADAIAAGFPVTRCPPCKHSAEPGTPIGVGARSKSRRQRMAERRQGLPNANTDGAQK